MSQTFKKVLLLASIIPTLLFSEDCFVSLNNAVVTTLQNQVDIQIAILNIQAQAGVLQTSAGPFDATVDNAAFYDRSHNAFGGPPTTYFATRDIEVDVAARKKTRLGTSFDFNATHRHYHENSRSSQFTFLVTQPLLRNFIYGIDRQTEEANRFELTAVEFDTFFTMSNKVLDTINRYWDTVGGIETVQVLTASVKRVEKLTEDIERYIEGRILAANDLNQPLATLANERQQLILSKQRLYSFKQLLMLAMGAIQEERCANFEECIDVSKTFPERLSVLENIGDYSDQLIQQAFGMRFDLLASTTREFKNLALLKGAKNQALPQLDAFTSYTRQNIHVKEFGAPVNSPDFGAGFPFNISRTSEWRVGFNFSVPICNDQALGFLKQQQAIYQQSIQQTQLLKQDVIVAVLDDINLLQSLEREIIEAERAAELYSILFNNEMKKIAAGYGSVFEMLNYETSWTSALLSIVDLNRQYFQTLADLRFQSGTLLVSNDDATLSFEDVTKLPLLLGCF